MIVTEVSVPLELPPSKTPRTPGVHVSNIIRCIATEQGILKPEWAEELSLTDARTITDPTAILRIRIGLAWEEHYIPTLPEVVDHPGEMCEEGIYMTHDGESVSFVHSIGRYAIRIHEVKATYKSTKTVGDLKSQWMWIAQMRAYCKARETRFATMHCLFLCGDYTYPIKPLLKVWDLEFTEDEVESTWTLLRDYRDFVVNKEQEKWLE